MYKLIKTVGEFYVYISDSVSDSSESDSCESESSESDTHESESSRSDTHESGSSMSDTHESVSSRSNTHESRSSEYNSPRESKNKGTNSQLMQSFPAHCENLPIQ